MQDFIFSAPSVYLLCSALLCLVMAVHALKQKRTRFSLYYAVLMGCSSLYTLGYGLEMASPDLAHMKVMLRIQYLALPFVPMFWVALAWSYMDPRGFPGKGLRLMLGVSLFIFLVFQSTDSHHLYYADLAYSRDSDLAVALISKGPVYWLYIVYLNVSLAAGVGLLFRSWRQSVAIYHRQAFFLLLGSLFPWLFHLIYQLGLSPKHLDMTPFGLAASGLIFSIAAFRHGLLDILPMARDAVFEGISEGVIVLDRSSRLVDFNRAAREFFPKLNHGIIGMTCDAIDEGGEFSLLLAQKARFEMAQALPEGVRQLEAHRYDLRDRKGRAIGLAVVIQDVTEKKRLMDEMLRLAQHDELTGIFNRRHLMVQSEREFLLARRHQKPLSLIILDIDFFKEVNDEHGHQSGDKLLSEIANTVRSRLRSTDILGRYGGDEFIITLPETSGDEACVIANKLRQACLDDCGTGISLGVADLAAENIDDFTTLLGFADQALYLAKKSGRGRVERFVASGTGNHHA